MLEMHITGQQGPGQDPMLLEFAYLPKPNEQYWALYTKGINPVCQEPGV